ncbi:MAG TPA: hypothetical protein VF407_16085 [Polyangiaceae bacterium]
MTAEVNVVVLVAGYTLAQQLRDARDMIVQLQRELERARGVIAEQRREIRSANRKAVAR